MNWPERLLPPETDFEARTTEVEGASDDPKGGDEIGRGERMEASIRAGKVALTRELTSFATTWPSETTVAASLACNTNDINTPHHASSNYFP
ncbi:hypothetical protein VNO78_23269 [Psophocarpus tetragonolobus]|uniref:Uncharacterized protein n=1 Tax=Psophocarpus tetragonolobus TaxID=3891 RepID=A0AAN9XDA9_PSOTE